MGAPAPGQPLFGFDLLALIEFRLESSRAAGVLREEISFLKRGSFAGGKEAGRRASRGCEDPVSFERKQNWQFSFGSEQRETQRNQPVLVARYLT